MDLNNRLRALEAAAVANAEPFADPRYAVELELTILRDRLIPLPDLGDVDLDATAEKWARDGERAGFVMLDGTTATAAELIDRAGETR